MIAFPVIPRHSTTLMLAVRTQLINQQTLPAVGYKLLMLQRSSKMQYMVRSGALCPKKIPFNEPVMSKFKSSKVK